MNLNSLAEDILSLLTKEDSGALLSPVAASSEYKLRTTVGLICWSKILFWISFNLFLRKYGHYISKTNPLLALMLFFHGCATFINVKIL